MQGYCIREGLKVYIPEYILKLNPDSCLLFGCRTQTSCFITAVIHLPVKIHELENLLSRCNSPKPSQRVSGRIGGALPACAWDVVGIWNSAHSDIGDHREHDGHVNTAHLLGALRHRLGDHREKDASWLVIEAKPSELPHAHLSPVGSMCASQPQLPILLIAYKTSTLLQSCVLQQPEPAVRSPSETADMIILTRILRQYCCLRERWAVTEKMVRVDSTDLIGRAVFREKQVVVPDSPISPVPHRAVSRVSKVIAWSSTGRQLVNSYNKIKLLSSDQPILRKWNVATSIALDVLLGLLLLYTLHSYGYNHITFATHILDFADRIVGLLQTILIWLMGVPAGLKLNAPLNFALGRFFLYHIYLWKGYIVVLLKPNLPALVFCVGVVGLGGLSFQISMLSDVVVLLTVHIYCFYVYAARLYYIMVYALRSLFR
ncbi:PREDICTED: uncharacterized protein LOC106815567, partial [Priapulus caudatus]|uniref:Uncharacterized protein LOC106815567 n=1 Tax=Priapulus caudatus TaxID=37621 RepID=A0ABM1ETK2_PRICU